MLIRFNVKNFLSFSKTKEGKSEEFSMIAGKVKNKKEHIYDDGKIKLLKLATVYGANASGKSNLVKALSFMKNVIISDSLKNYVDKYCKTNENNRNRESYFELEIKIDNKYYSYGFETILSRGEFVSEWLIEILPNSEKENLIFSRDIKKGRYTLGKELEKSAVRKNIEIYIEDIKNDSEILFLKVMNQNKNTLYKENKNDAVKMLKDVYLWINYQLDINYPNRSISNYLYMVKAERVEEICRIISAFGIGITNFKLVEIPIKKIVEDLSPKIAENVLSNVKEHIISEARANKDKKDNRNIIMRSNENFFILSVNDDLDNVSCYTIKFIHETPNVLYDLTEESDGTVRILDLIEILLSNESKTYVIDELDRCLHPSLTYKFIEVFLDLAAKRNIQLIATTHESRLLDFDLLRRDEVWFINKRNTGESDIYSLEEYNERFDKKIDKAYLEGRYGGVPIFSTLFPIVEEN